jgi:hypothetical protein
LQKHLCLIGRGDRITRCDTTILRTWRRRRSREPCSLETSRPRIVDRGLRTDARRHGRRGRGGAARNGGGQGWCASGLRTDTARRSLWLSAFERSAARAYCVSHQFSHCSLARRGGGGQRVRVVHLSERSHSSSDSATSVVLRGEVHPGGLPCDCDID